MVTNKCTLTAPQSRGHVLKLVTGCLAWPALSVKCLDTQKCPDKFISTSRPINLTNDNHLKQTSHGYGLRWAIHNSSHSTGAMTAHLVIHSIIVDRVRVSYYKSAYIYYKFYTHKRSKTHGKHAKHHFTYCLGTARSKLPHRRAKSHSIWWKSPPRLIRISQHDIKIHSSPHLMLRHRKVFHTCK